MKIVQILPELNEGGVERGTMELSRELVKRGFESVVISRGGKLATQINHDGGLHVTLDVCSKNPLSAPWRIFKLYQTLKKLSPDILHVRSRVPAWMSFFANKWLNLPVISTVHGFNSVGFYSSIMTKADHVICVSNSIKTFIQKHYHTPDEKITVIPRGIDLVTFNPQNIDHEFIKDFKLHYQLEDKWIITTVGRITQLKDLETFIKAIALLKEDHPHVIGLIVGGVREDKQEYFTSLQNLVQQLHVKEHIIFAGSISQIAEIYSLSDVVVSCSKKPESFGRSVAEAIAMNTPVVATGHGGVLDIIKENENGFFTNISDADDVSQKLLLTKNINFTGHTYIQHAFSLEQMIQLNITQYKKHLLPLVNVFLVQTPFQLFNAIEASQRFHNQELNILIFINRGNPRNYNQIKEILKFEHRWFQIIEIPFITRWEKLGYPFYLNKILVNLKKFTIINLYVALYRNIAAHIINSLSCKNIILYDDGNNILKTIQKLGRKEKKTSHALINIIPFYKTSIRFLEKCTIFSLFDLSIYTQLPNRVIPNNYLYFKNLCTSFKTTNQVFFIGSKMIENGLTQSNFEFALKSIILHYKKYQQNVIYIPHRYEKLDYLEDLSKSLGFTLKPLKTIIEYSLIKEQSIPCEIATFRSTAIDSLKLIFPNVSLLVFELNETLIENSKKREFFTVYSYFREKQYKTRIIK